MAALALLTPALTAHAQATPPGRSSSSADSGLSPAQRTRAQARQTQFQKDIAALQADKTLTDAQKRAKYAVLARAMDKDMMAILTPAQRAQVMSQRQIAAQFQKDVATLQADKTLTDTQKRTRYEALRQAANQKALATLPPAQRARIEKQQQVGVARQAELKRLAQELQKSETPAQEKQIHDIGLAAGAQIQTVVADKSMAPALKTAKIKELEQQAQAKINPLLTPSQRRAVCSHSVPGKRTTVSVNVSVKWSHSRKSGPLQRSRFFLCVLRTRRLRRDAAESRVVRPLHRAAARGTAGAARCGDDQSLGNGHAGPGREAGQAGH